MPHPGSHLTAWSRRARATVLRLVWHLPRVHDWLWPDRDTGAWGERLAASFLRSRGLQILTRNFRTSSGEIDLIARDDRQLVFVEVKTIATGSLVGGFERVRTVKRRRVRRAVDAFLARSRGGFDGWRFDIVVVEFDWRRRRRRRVIRTTWYRAQPLSSWQR